MCSNSIPAQSMSTYMKYRYGGWVDNIPEITEGGVYTLNTPWSETNNAYKIASPNSSYEYFIVEYRNKNHYYENKLPGDGFTNMITPTSGVLMGCLGMAKIPYNVWFKFFWKFILLMIIVGFLLLIPTVYFPLNGF
jgi:hypothetical protein